MKHNDDFADLSATELILKAENAMLKIQLEEKEETLRAIQCGEIDALVVQSQSGPQVYTLQGLDAELNRFRGEILERISEAIIVLNEDHHIVYINAAAEKMYGIKSPAILGAPICMLYQTQWLHPYDEAEMVTQLNEKGHWNGEHLHLKTSGEIIHIEILVTRLPQNIKPCYSDILVIRDITERKKVGDRIRADAERLACVLAAQRQIAAAELDGPNLLQLILKTMARITGADGASIEMLEGDMVNCEAAIGVAEPFIGLKLQTKDTLSEICISSGKLQRVDDIENKLSENLTFSRTNDIKSLVMIPLRYGKNLFGLLKLFSSRLKTFDDEAEKILKLMAEFLGAIIARQKIIKALTESETRLAVAVNATKIGISEFEIATGKMLWTEQFANILGIKKTLDTTISQVYSYSDWVKCIHPDDLPRVETEIHHCIEEKKPYEIEYRVIWDDGNIRWLAEQGILFSAAYGQPERLLSIIQDITSLKNEEKRLLEEDRRKNLFLATLAHELRNPLAPLSNGLRLLENSGLNHPTIDKVHKMMTRQLSHLVRLVDDLMEVSRVTRGLVSLRKERIDLTEVLLNAIETSQPLIKNGKHQLETNISSQSLILEGDKVRLTQIVTNILNNAAKYTLEGGHIWLSAHRDGTEAIVSIRDNGLGIPAEAQTKIFDMFFQIKQSDDRAQGGLGIGLTLVKSLIDMHGGSVEIHSEGVNQGAEFILRLPLVVEEINNFKQPDQGESELGKLSSHHILIVDDNKDAADSLALLLGQLVAEVKTVNDGAASIELLKTFKPSVILLDIGMPGMDGYQVARWVRQQPLIQHIKLIAMTGWGQEEDRRKSFEAGIDHHLVKPVDFGTLMKLLQLNDNAK